MTVDDLIAIASRGPLNAVDVERAANELGTSAGEMFDRLARRIAEGYASGEYELGICDAAMNEVFGYTHVTTNIGLSPFAWGVFEAFDQGEFRGEEVTKILIATVLGRGFLKHGDGL